MTLLKALFTFMALVVLGGVLTACTELQAKKATDVIVRLQANAETVLVTGCTNAPTAQVLVAMVMEFIPEGTDKDKLQRGITVANANIEAICAKVMTPEALAVPPSVQ